MKQLVVQLQASSGIYVVKLAEKVEVHLAKSLNSKD